MAGISLSVAETAEPVVTGKHALIGYSIKLGNSPVLLLFLDDNDLESIAKQVADINADRAHPVGDYPDDVPASLVEAQAVDE